MTEKRENDFYNITNKWPIEKEKGTSCSYIPKNNRKNKVPYPFLNGQGVRDNC